MSLSRHGYPLGALFVLVALCAVMIGGITPLFRVAGGGDDAAVRSIDAGMWMVALGAGFVGGLVVGMVVGLLQFRAGLGLLMGGTLGAVIGMSAGAMALLSGNQIGAAAAAMTAGSALVVGVAVLMRRAS
jgi:hypothetical protein